MYVASPFVVSALLFSKGEDPNRPVIPPSPQQLRRLIYSKFANVQIHTLLKSHPPSFALTRGPPLNNRVPLYLYHLS